MASATKAQSGGGTASSFTPVITLTTISDQADLSAMTVSLDTVTIGGVTKTPSAVAFRVNGATTGLADPTAVGGTTFTPTRGGEYTIGGTVTIDGVPYPITTQTVTVGRLMFSMWWVAAVLVDWTTITTTKGNGDTYDAGNGTIDFICDATHGSFVASGDANGLVVTKGASASTSSRFQMDTPDLVASLGIDDDTPLCIVSEEIGYESTGARDAIGYLNSDGSSRVLARYAQTSGPAYAVDEDFNLNGAGIVFTGDDTPSAEVRWRGLMKLAPDTFRQWFDTDTSRTMPAFDSSESSHTVRPVVMGKNSAAPQGASDYAIATDRVFCGQCNESGEARKILSTRIWVVL